MRIIAGTHKGRRISPNPNFKLRPTTDFAKEALFNILANQLDFQSITALDLFSGTGSISYELASRGCPAVHSVEMNPKHADFIRKTAAELKLPAMKVIRDDVFHFLKIAHAKYDFIFADPPYDLPTIEEVPTAILSANILNDNALVIVEHSSNNDFSNLPAFLQVRNYGSVHFSFFAPPTEA